LAGNEGLETTVYTVYTVYTIGCRAPEREEPQAETG